MKLWDKTPQIIQGGMGAGVSNWNLAKAVSTQGQLGVVSGTALDAILARRLQLGDPDGDIRRALLHFPWPEISQRLLARYFIPGGKAPGAPFKAAAMPAVPMRRRIVELIIVANFVEVFLAKEGHHGPVGINYLEKIQLPTLPSLLGAMLAGVDCVLMGAGIPLTVPGVLDGLSSWQPVACKLHVEDNPEHHDYIDRFDAAEYLPGAHPPLLRPKFFAVVSSDIVARTLARKATGTVDGFIVENHAAGGHNAPPRKRSAAQANGAPRSGEAFADPFHPIPPTAFHSFPPVTGKGLSSQSSGAMRKQRCSMRPWPHSISPRESSPN